MSRANRRPSRYSRALLAILTLGLALPALSQRRFSISPVPLRATRPSPRSDHLTVVLNAAKGFFLILHGGRDLRTAKADTWVYQVNENRWDLLVASPRLDNHPPPPLYGSVGGYRYLPDHSAPYLYVTQGTDGAGNFTNDMWVMDFATYSWRMVALDGDVPSPRFGAIGSLERFVKPDGTAVPTLIVSHGYGPDGPLSDTYKCSFHPTDPYRATWRRLLPPVNQYSTRAPHPMWMQASTFTATRDIAVFGGCYASTVTGGICPTRDTWMLKYTPERTVAPTSLPDSQPPLPPVDDTDPAIMLFESETDMMAWKQMPRSPAPRIGAVMAQALNAFEGAYSDWTSLAVLYSGSQDTAQLPSDQVLSMPLVSGTEIDLLSTASRAWVRERVHYVGPARLENTTLAARRSATMSVVRDTRKPQRGPDEPDEFYLIFGGQLENGNYTNALLRLSFDPFVASEMLASGTHYVSRPLVHGVLMFLSWGVLMVAGAFSARYMRKRNGRSRYFLVHLIGQCSALVLAWAGVGIAIYSRRRSSAWFAHANIGIILIVLASLQPIVAVAGILVQLRRSSLAQLDGMGGSKSSLRGFPQVCRLYHAVAGVLIISLGFVNITIGLFLFVAPTIIWVHWIAYSAMLFIFIFWLEAIGGRRSAGGLSIHPQKSVVDRIGKQTSYKSGESTGPSPSQISISPSPSRLHPTGNAQDSMPFDELPPTIGRTQDEVEYEGGERMGLGLSEVALRDRLYSEASTVYTYRDPDAY